MRWSYSIFVVFLASLCAQRPTGADQPVAEPLVIGFKYAQVRQEIAVTEGSDFHVITDTKHGQLRAFGQIGTVADGQVDLTLTLGFAADGRSGGQISMKRRLRLGEFSDRGVGSMRGWFVWYLWVRRGVDPVPALVEALHRADGNSMVAAQHLGRLKAGARGAVPHLIEILKRKDVIGLRARAAMALGEIGPAAKAAVPTLVEQLEAKPMGPLQVVMAAALWKIAEHPRALPALTSALSDSDRIVRIKALDALAEMGVAAAAAESNVAGLLRDEDDEVRAKAAYVLWSSMRNPRAINALDEMLRADNSGYERAAQSLDRIGYPDAHRAAKSLAARVFSGRAPSPYVTSALRTIDPAAIGTLPVLLDTVRKDNTPKSREAAGVALAAFGSPIVPQLHRLLDGEHEADWQVAMYALGNMEDAAAIQMLAAALRHANPQVRKLAAGWLHGIEGPIALAIPDLVHALNDEVEAVRVEASSALTFVGRPALPALKSLLNSGSARVRESVAELIEYIELEHEMDAAVDGLTRE